MTREGKWPLAALVAAVLAAALLVACGGSDSDSGTGSSTEATTAGSTTSAQKGEDEQNGSRDGSSQDQEAGEGSGDDDGESENGGKSSRSKNVVTPLEVSGGGAEQFHVNGGDNSIQEYGEESDEAELQEVAEIVHGFFVARAEEKWNEACSYLAKSNAEQLEQLASQAPELKGAGCGPSLEAFTRPLPASIQREITTVDAGSFRDDGEQGFLIYRGAGDAVYAMPLRSEGGSWKVAALSGTTLS